MTASRSLIALGALLAGCTELSDPCFTPASTVEDPRVLSVRADPPEAVVDLDAGDVPSIAISAVVASANPNAFRQGTSVSVVLAGVTARLCVPPPDSGQQPPPDCPAGTPAIAESARVPTAAEPLIIRAPAELLRQSLRQDPLRGAAGIELRLQLDVAVQGARLAASKTLLFRQAGAPGSVNHGLEIAGVEVIYAGGERLTVPRGDRIPLVVAEPVGMRPLLTPGAGAEAAVEEYEALGTDGRMVALHEYVTYKFYAANSLFFGRPDYSHAAGTPVVTYDGVPADEADEPEPGAPVPAFGIVTLMSVFPGDQIDSFWIVARDGRGGEASLLMSWEAAEHRSACQGPPPHFGCPQLYFGCQ